MYLYTGERGGCLVFVHLHIVFCVCLRPLAGIEMWVKVDKERLEVDIQLQTGLLFYGFTQHSIPLKALDTQTWCLCWSIC